MTGDKVDKATMVYGDKDDKWVANKVRMLLRNDLDHEAVCVGGRDRIMYLSQQLEAVTAERDRYKAALERMTEMGCIGSDGSGKCGDCPVCDANEALSEPPC